MSHNSTPAVINSDITTTLYFEEMKYESSIRDIKFSSWKRNYIWLEHQAVTRSDLIVFFF